MDDALHVVGGNDALDQVLVSRVADEQRNTVGQRCGETCLEIVDHDNAFAGFNQGQNHMTSDVAGAAGNEHAHGFSNPPILLEILSRLR